MKDKLNWLGVASMYIGIIMGAGFASGRECWQFFGVFGKNGYLGAVLATLCFVLVSAMLSYIALSKNTAELGALISPFSDPRIDRGIGWTLAAIYYSMIIAMTAAGGSLLHQQFGIHRAVGGAIIAVLVLFTVMGDFSRISGIFGRLIPLLFLLGVVTILLVVFSDIGQSGRSDDFAPGGITPNWAISALVFLSYNSLGMITMAGFSALNAKSRRHAFGGAAVGTLLLGVLTVLLLTALRKDMAFSQALDLPMLGYAGRIHGVLNAFYALVLYGAVYSTAASTYYGFGTMLPEGQNKRKILCAGVVIGFVLGLSGFKTLVEYLYPLQGYLGMVMLLLVLANFLREWRRSPSRR